MVNEARRRANDKYDKENARSLSVRFFPPDHDVYDWLKSLDGSTAANVKRILRDAMEREGGVHEA